MAKRKWHDYSENTGNVHATSKRRKTADSNLSAYIYSSKTNEPEAATSQAAAPSLEIAVKRAIRVLKPPPELSTEKRKRWRALTRAAAESIIADVATPYDETTLRAPNGPDYLSTAVNALPTLDSPPAGLSKAARKRWRKQRRIAASAPGDPATEMRMPADGQGEQLSHERAKNSNKGSSSDGRLLREYSTTGLPPILPRIWQDDEKSSDCSKSSSLPAESLEDKGNSTSITKKPDIYPDVAPMRSSGPSLNMTKSRLALSKASILDKQANSERINPIKHVHTIRKKPDFGIGASGKQSLSANRTVPRRASDHKPTSIPSHAELPDANESFQRFTAFLHGRSADSSEDESGTSEDENYDRSDDMESDGAVSPIDAQHSSVLHADSVAGNLPQPVDYGMQLLNQLGPDSNHDREPTSSRPAILSSNTEETLPTVADHGPKTRALTPFSQRANVGIKRQVSFLGSGRDVTPSGSQATADVLITKQSKSIKKPASTDESDDDDDYDNVLQDINEISRNVFAATRALPASKLPISTGARHEDEKDGLLTSGSSNCRGMTPFKTDSMEVHNYSGQSHVFHLPPNEIICNSVHVPDSIEPPKPEKSQQSEALGSSTVTTEPNDTIAVAPISLARQKSTSPSNKLHDSPTRTQHASHPIEDQSIVTEVSRASENRENISLEHQYPVPAPSRKKRKMTGRTSKHFTPDKPRRSKRISRKVEKIEDHSESVSHEPVALLEVPKKESTGKQTTSGKRRKSKPISSMVENASEAEAIAEPTMKDPIEGIDGPEIGEATPTDPPSRSTRSSSAKKRKGTGKKSNYFTPSKPPLDPEVIDRVDFYNTTSSGKKARAPAGISTAPVPPINSERFGIIQEKLWAEPFWLLIAVTFLNQTTGRAAAPVFWDLKARYPTPEALSLADEDQLFDLIWKLGFGRQRSRRVILMAQTWLAEPPARSMRWRTLHYPLPGDGKVFKKGVVVEEDADECEGALEIGHIPGCGPYAWDSWRIFCRDVLRGVAADYNCKGVTATDFVPEWKKVLPLDKELRACLRWMWLREGWIWDCESGERREADEEEMELARKGEMVIWDAKERQFAAQAAGTEAGEAVAVITTPRSAEQSHCTDDARHPATPELVAQNEESGGEDIVVSPAKRLRKRRGYQNEESTDENIQVSPAKPSRTRKTRHSVAS